MNTATIPITKEVSYESSKILFNAGMDLKKGEL